LKVGQWVRVRRAGDVIPEVLGPALHEGAAEELLKDIVAPKNCPCCQGLLKEEDDLLYCCAGYQCLDQKVLRLAYALSQEALNVSGLSTQSLRKAVAAGLISSPADIFALSRAQWESLEGIGPKLATSFCEKLQVALNTTPARFILSCNIPLVGKTTAHQLFDYLSWEGFLQSTQEELESLPNVGPITAYTLFSFKESEFFKKEYQAFRQLGLLLESAKNSLSLRSARLKGRHIVVTGTFDFFTREQWNQWVLSHGGKSESNITQKTQLVLAGIAAGSKRKKAIDLNIPIIEDRYAKEFVESIDAGDKEAAECLQLFLIKPD